MKITNIGAGIAAFVRSLGTTTVPGAGEGILSSHLEDRNGKPLALIQSEQTNSVQSAMPMGGVNDGMFKLNRVDRSGAMAVSTISPLFHEPFDSTTINALRWAVVSTTFAPTVTVSGFNLNPTNLVTANAVTNFISLTKFLKVQRGPLYNKWRVRYNKIANTQLEFGFGVSTGVATVPNSVSWKLVGNTAFGVLNFGGTELATTAINITSIISDLNYYTFDIFADDDDILFTIHDSGSNIVAITTLKMPSSQSRMFCANRLPIFIRLYNGAIAPVTAPIAIISDIFVGQVDTLLNRTYDDYLGAIGYNGYTNNQTGVQFLQWANSAEPANATLSNTVAGYSGIGGKYQFAAPAGAVTDYLLFGVAITDPTTLKIKGVRITAKSIGAVGSATIPTELEWFIVTNMATVSLAAAGAIRIPLGIQTFPINTPIATIATEIVVNLTNMAIRCDPGKAIGIGVRIPGGAATASQVIKGTITPISTFE